MSEELFREEQRLPSLVGAVLGGATAAGLVGMLATRQSDASWARRLLVGAATTTGLLALLTPMRTRVTAQGVELIFGLPGWVRFHIRADEIQEAEAVTYHPLADFGGWGIRLGRDGTWAYTMRGNTGVRVCTTRRTFLVGSQDPEALERALLRIRAAGPMPVS